jgi:hypothetical protein
MVGSTAARCGSHACGVEADLPASNGPTRAEATSFVSTPVRAYPCLGRSHTHSGIAVAGLPIGPGTSAVGRVVVSAAADRIGDR